MVMAFSGPGRGGTTVRLREVLASLVVVMLVAAACGDDVVQSDDNPNQSDRPETLGGLPGSVGDSDCPPQKPLAGPITPSEIVSVEAHLLALDAMGAQAIDEYSNALAAAPPELCLLFGRLRDDAALAYHIELLLREEAMLPEMISSHGSDAESMDQTINRYMEAEVERLAAAGIVGDGVRAGVAFLRESFGPLRELLDEGASLLECGNRSTASLDLDRSDSPGFETPADAVEAIMRDAELLPDLAWKPGKAFHTATAGDDEVWVQEDTVGSSVARVLVTPSIDRWFVSNVTYCTEG